MRRGRALARPVAAFGGTRVERSGPRKAMVASMTFWVTGSLVGVLIVGFIANALVRAMDARFQLPDEGTAQSTEPERIENRT